MGDTDARGNVSLSGVLSEPDAHRQPRQSPTLGVEVVDCITCFGEVQK
jgi:hypothetical protein